LSCARTWSDCRAFLSMPYSFDVLVFNSFKHSCSLSFKFSRWNLEIGNYFLWSLYTTFQAWLSISCITLFLSQL
jgi:hypothetical protein